MNRLLKRSFLFLSFVFCCSAYSNEHAVSNSHAQSTVLKKEISVAIPAYGSVPYWSVFEDSVMYYDLLFDMAEKLEFDLNYIEFDDTESILKAVETGEVDLAFGFIKTPEKSERVLFSLPVVTHHVYRWYKRTSLSDPYPLPRRWGCIKGSFTCNEINVEDSHVAVVFDSATLLVDALSQGSISGALVTIDVINHYHQTVSKGDWVGEHQFLSVLDAAFVTGKHQYDLMNTINNYLSANQSNAQRTQTQLGKMRTLGGNAFDENDLVIRYSVEKESFPLSYVDKDTYEVTGYIHELLMLYSRKSGVQFEYVDSDGRALEEMLLEGSIDFYPMTSLKASRSNSVIQTLPFLSKEWVKVRSAGWSSKQPLIGVLDRTNCLFSGLEGPLDTSRYKAYVDLQSIQKALRKGEIQSAFLPKAIAHYYLYYSNDNSFEIVSGSEAQALTQQLVFVTKPTLQPIINILNTAITSTDSNERDLAMQKHQPIQVQYGYHKDYVLKSFLSLILLVLVATFFTRKKYVLLSRKSKEREARLQTSSEQLLLLNAVIEHYPGMIAILNEKNETVVANHEFTRCYQGCIDNKCVNNMSCCGLLHAMVSDDLDKNSQDLNINKEICPIDGRFYKIHRETITNSFNFVSYRILILTDITDYQTQQKQINASRIEALNALKARDAFLAMISHELRTPLAAVIGVLDLLNPEIKKRENRELFVSAQSSANRLNLLVNDILDFSKIEAGQMQLDPTDGCLFEELAPQLRAFEALAKNKKVEFFVHWYPSNQAHAVVDWSRLNQIVSNIISNAIKFTDNGSVVISIQHTASELNISVKDSGCGMTKKQLDHIFLPFVQADRTISRRFGGSGLGMSIVNNLVTLMSGTIVIDSELGIGTKVNICFPVNFNPIKTNQLLKAFSQDERVSQWLKTFGAQCAPYDCEMASEIEHHGVNVYPDIIFGMLRASSGSSNADVELHLGYEGTVLVADDDPINRLLFEKQLSKLGVKYVSVDDGQEAYNYLLQHPTKVDILITDCHMPNMNGYQLARGVRANKQLESLPIIGCTAEDSRLAAQRAEQAGMNMVLYKPYTIDALSLAIKNHSNLTLQRGKSSETFEWLTQYELDEKIEIAKVLMESLKDELQLIHDNACIREVAHRVKGSATMLGLEKLAELARASELVTPELSKDVNNAFIDEIETTRAELAQWLSKHQAA